MTDCERLAVRVFRLERECERKQTEIARLDREVQRLTAWIDAMLQAAEARQDELVALNERRA